MFFVEANAGTTEYLTQAEKEHSNQINEFDLNSINEFAKQNNIKSNQLNIEVYQKYLDQKNPHYKAKFIGELSKDWKIGDYTSDKYISLMSNKIPKQIEKPKDLKLKKNGNIISTKENSKLGIDTVSSCPKSVSIEFSRSNKEQKDKIINALNKSTEQLLDKLAKDIKPSCKKNEYQDFVEGSCKLLATSFTHYENRGYIEEDKSTNTKIRRLEPNLHTHNTIFNYAEFELYKLDKENNRIKDEKGNFITEKKILAIDPINLFKNQLENSALFDTLLNSNLQKEGFKTEQHNNSFRIKGYTDAQENSLSKRSEEIKNYIEIQKEKGTQFSSYEHAETDYLKSIRKNTALTKEVKTAEDILNNVNETINKNIKKEDFDIIDKIQSIENNENKEIDYKKIMSLSSFETKGIIKETEIKAEILKEIRFNKTFNNIEDIDKCVKETFDNLTNQKLMGEKQLIKTTSGDYTRLDIVKSEKQLEYNISFLKNETTIQDKNQIEKNNKIIDNFIEEKAKTYALNDGQINSLNLSKLQKPITLVVGDAGTGKTTSFIAGTTKLNKENNIKVIGISVSSKTTQALSEADIDKKNLFNTKQFIFNAFEINKETNEITNKINQKFLNENKNACFIFDEAGMAGSNDMKKITDFVRVARENGGKAQLILVGDHKQLDSVDYGNAFLNIQNQLDKNSICRLTDNTRQKEGAAKEIAESYKEKDSEKLISVLKENNLLITKKTEEELIDKLANDYINDKSKSKLIVCSTNKEIDLINDTVRDKLNNQFQEEKKQSKLNKTKIDKSKDDFIDFDKSKFIEVSKSNSKTFEKSTRNFAPGENIVFLKNDKKLGISNSDKGKIKSIKEINKDNFELTIELNNKEIKIETNKYNYFNHSYAVSTHKSQGITVENTYHYVNTQMANSNNCYVNGSRHKLQYKAYIKEDEIEEYKKKMTIESKKESTLNDINCQNELNKFNYNKATEEYKEDLNNNHLKPQVEKQIVINNNEKTKEATENYIEIQKSITEEMKNRQERIKQETKRLKNKEELNNLSQVKQSIDKQKEQDNQNKQIKSLNKSDIEFLKQISQDLDNSNKKNQSLKQTYKPKMY